MAARLTSDDRTEIMDLLARYSLAADTADIEGYAAVFTPDAILELGSGRREGHEQIKEFMRKRWATPDERPLDQHHLANFVFDGDGERATVRCYVTILSVAGERSVSTVMMGQYIDELVKRDGRWLIAKRSLRTWNRDTVRDPRSRSQASRA